MKEKLRLCSTGQTEQKGDKLPSSIGWRHLYQEHMERVVEQEWLDSDRGTRAEIDAALRSVSRVNQRYGGVRLHARLLRRALAGAERSSPVGRPRILEVASGRADVLRRALVATGITAEVTLLDRSQCHLPHDGEWSPPLPRPHLLTGDALALPLEDKSVDVVACCLFLHHLEPAEILRFLEQACRVARIAVLINDLERTRVHYWLARLNGWMDPSRISRHDGPASVRRAYTYGELRQLLGKTGRPFELQRAFLYRLGGVLWCS
jgi:ubiquinone/menaquinone biosynthesis C-methylase UbiE